MGESLSGTCKNISHTSKYNLTVFHSSRGMLKIIIRYEAPVFTPSGFSDDPVNGTTQPRIVSAFQTELSKALFAIDGRRVTYTLDVVHFSMRIAAFSPSRLIFLWVPLESAFWFIDVPGFWDISYKALRSRAPPTRRLTTPHTLFVPSAYLISDLKDVTVRRNSECLDFASSRMRHFSFS